ncbi:MAG TPA: pyridoxamine 5'-phosphate oxidase family protein [Candidatus Acidoferrales bacterium]
MNSTSTENHPADDLAKLRDLIKDIKFAMLTTVSRAGLLVSRPMTTQNENFDGVLWFFAGLDSPKTEDLEAHPEVNLAYAKPGSMEFVSVSGTAKISMDRAKMQELWSDTYKAWFPQGLDDPNLCLLRIEVTAAEYWDSPSAKVVQILGYLKSKITGEKENLGEHRRVNVAHAAKSR